MFTARHGLIAGLAAGLLVLASPASAQSSFPTTAGGGANAVSGTVLMCLNASNVAIPTNLSGGGCPIGSSVGTVTANQGTANTIANSWPVYISLGGAAITSSAPFPVYVPQTQVVIGGATAAAQAIQVGGVYNSSAPTLTSGFGAADQLDVNGNLFVDLKTALPTGANTIGNVTTANIQASINNGASAPTNAILAAGRYFSAPATLTNGQTTPFLVDVNGNQLVNLNTALPAGTNNIGSTNANGVYLSAPTEITSGNSTENLADAYGALRSNGLIVVPSYNAAVIDSVPVAGLKAQICGSASKTIAVTSISYAVNGTATTGGINYVKYSTAATGGTSTAVTIVPSDANDSAATASVLNYTVAPTAGTSIGAFFTSVVVVQNTNQPVPLVWQALGGGIKPIILRGAASCIGVIEPAITGTQSIDFSWQEY